MSIKKGIYAASMTVINKDLSVNIDSTIEHSERLIQQGCHGVVIGGSTGMSQLISSNEKRKLIDKMSVSKFKDDFVFGTGANSINENAKAGKNTVTQIVKNTSFFNQGLNASSEQHFQGGEYDCE